MISPGAKVESGNPALANNWKSIAASVTALASHVSHTSRAGLYDRLATAL
jgi:hypothetical protein